MHTWPAAGQPIGRGWNATQICGKVVSHEESCWQPHHDQPASSPPHDPQPSRRRRRSADDLCVGHQPRRHHQGAAAADRSGDRGGHHRPLLRVLLFAGGRTGDRRAPRGSAAGHARRGDRTARSVEPAGAALHPHRCAGHRPHGDGRVRRGVLGRAGDRRRHAARALGRRAGEAGSRLQQLRPRPDGARRAWGTRRKGSRAGFRR